MELKEVVSMVTGSVIKDLFNEFLNNNKTSFEDEYRKACDKYDEALEKVKSYLDKNLGFDLAYEAYDKLDNAVSDYLYAEGLRCYRAGFETAINLALEIWYKSRKDGSERREKTENVENKNRLKNLQKTVENVVV